MNLHPINFFEIMRFEITLVFELSVWTCFFGAFVMLLFFFAELGHAFGAQNADGAEAKIPSEESVIAVSFLKFDFISCGTPFYFLIVKLLWWVYAIFNKSL